MKILVAIDSSPASALVISQISARPWPAESTFEVVTVADPSHVPDVAFDEVERSATQVAEAGADRLLANNLKATAFLLQGHPKAAIVDRAQAIGADFIVIGSHNGGGLGRFLLGGVASAVVRHAPCSVEVVRTPAHPAGAMKILLATDGSANSLLAAHSIAERPWPAESEVRVLTAVELSLTPWQSALEPPYLNNDMVETQRAEAMKRAEKAIQSAEELLASTALKTAESISVLIQSPKQIILDEAKAWEADLIVVGSHGRRGLDRFLLGSVSEAVAMHAPCSVEVIRSPALED